MEAGDRDQMCDQQCCTNRPRHLYSTLAVVWSSLNIVSWLGERLSQSESAAVVGVPSFPPIPLPGDLHLLAGPQLSLLSVIVALLLASHSLWSEAWGSLGLGGLVS